MTFNHLLAQIVQLLQEQGRVSYRALKKQFELNDEDIEALKDEIIDARRLAVDENGKVLVCIRQADAGRQPKPSSPPSQRPTHDQIVSKAERRQLTVVFCDLVGSTHLSDQLDPEELREVILDYQEACTSAIQAYQGHVAQYLGDGLLIYFGHPQAHEDDGHQAVLAALDILGAIETRNASLEPERGVRLSVRLGIHTGLVVVGEIGGGDRHEQLALGETPNIAARLQGLAEPGTVVISASTYQLVEGLFSCRDLGFHSLKGISQPVQLYQVIEETGATSRFEAMAGGELTPLAGREPELRRLLECWKRVKAGAGQVVLLRGEAGIGKSRLVQEIKGRLTGEPHAWVPLHCSPRYQNTALYPVADHWLRLLRGGGGDSPEQMLRNLEHNLSQYSLDLQEAVPLMASALSIPLPGDRYSPLSLTPVKQRQKTLDLFLQIALELAARQPAVVVVEGLHWVDPSTLELLNLLIDQAPSRSLFILFTSRPDFRTDWCTRAHVVEMPLDRLTRYQVEQMVAGLTGGKSLPAEVLDPLVVRTDGIPLFVEELTRMVLDSGLLNEAEGAYRLAGPLPPLAIPATLQDSLMARLDRLGEARQVAQMGAALGREFSFEILQAVMSLEEETLQREVDKLVAADLLKPLGSAPRASYIFKHVLIQETAYQSLLKSTRQRVHRNIAEVLEGRFSETVETHPELLAHHYTEAGLSTQAIAYWHKAGERAIKRSANLEAISHLTQGLELVMTLPDTAQRRQQELNLQITLGAPLQATRGMAAPEVGETYSRALALCQQVGETSQFFAALFGLWSFRSIRAESQPVQEQEQGKQLLLLAQRAQDPALLLQAHHALWTTSFRLGELNLARQHAEEGMLLYDRRHHSSHAYLYGGHDPGGCCRCFAALALWGLGYPDQALEQINEALLLTRELSHPHSLAEVLGLTAMLHQFRGEVQSVKQRAEEMIAISRQQKFPLWMGFGKILQGWALAEQGDGDQGVAQIRHSMSTAHGTGIQMFRPFCLGLLAQAYSQAGNFEAAIAASDEALGVVEQNGERWYQAELHRLQGEWLLRRGDADARAEECFSRALDVAGRQQARSLELRAAMSLGRLWLKQQKSQEASRLLKDLYGWFSEGLETTDLQAAKGLLDFLAGSADRS